MGYSFESNVTKNAFLLKYTSCFVFVWSFANMHKGWPFSRYSIPIANIIQYFRVPDPVLSVEDLSETDIRILALPSGARTACDHNQHESLTGGRTPLGGCWDSSWAGQLRAWWSLPATAALCPPQYLVLPRVNFQVLGTRPQSEQN